MIQNIIIIITVFIRMFYLYANSVFIFVWQASKIQTQIVSLNYDSIT